uniref:Uncharacterized protein n=1 Tax=Rhizophora mucronata TaxID=61149 RepID=A0A2P2QXB1_RHIMU
MQAQAIKCPFRLTFQSATFINMKKALYFSHILSSLFYYMLFGKIELIHLLFTLHLSLSLFLSLPSLCTTAFHCNLSFNST